MRRALLTAGSLAPFTVGNSTDPSVGGAGASVLWDNFNPAASTGVLATATIEAYSSATRDFAIFTISPTDVITAITATITTGLVAGTNTITLPAPLPVNAGDFIGVWFSGGSVTLRYATAAAGFGRKYVVSAIAKPSAGATLTPAGTLATSHWLLSATT